MRYKIVQDSKSYAGSGHSMRTHTNTLFHYLRVQDSIKNKILKKTIQELYVGVFQKYRYEARHKPNF